MPERSFAARVEALLGLAEKSAGIDPRCATQVAVAQRGSLVVFESFGRAGFEGDEVAPRPAGPDTLFSIYSVTKAIVSSASWLLLQDGRLALEDRVATHIPEFAQHGKQEVTVEQLLTHTAGFPSARLSNSDWLDPPLRTQRMAEWPLEWPPGSRFVYHGTSSMWVLAELITRAAGADYRDFIRTRICEPLGLSDLYIGLPASENARVADVVSVGDAMTGDERAASPVDAPVIDEELLEYGNSARSRAIGGPGGGAIATAADVALFYQGLLEAAHGRGSGPWRPETLRDAWTVRNASFIDPMTSQPALRGLGVVMAGASGRMWRGFSEACSAAAFGHMGAGGQVSWADPETGLSFAFLTNGAHRNPARQGARGYQLSTLAAACRPPTGHGSDPG